MSAIKRMPITTGGTLGTILAYLSSIDDIPSANELGNTVLVGLGGR